jgi:asparagine synthase (glutamine-hydrolysing)
MCGIAGYFGWRHIAQRASEDCLKLMRRRGPDHQACRRWTHASGRHVILLHSRLKIIDLDERANQPFRIGCKWMVFNGELYNYLELKSDLEREGYNLKTTSDTEVLLAVLDRWGVVGLERCEGMWAFAVYDEIDGTLTLSRDRFGEKPLYLFEDETGLYFASEVKFLRQLLGRALAPNIGQLYRYLVNGYKALYKTDETFFHGLTELHPGSFLQLDMAGKQRREKYWRPDFRQETAMSYEEAVQGCREHLIRSVELRLRADVPLAFCMSGGVDSNALISIAKRVFEYDVHGFTIVNSDARYDEQEAVDRAVAELGIRHTAIPADAAGFLGALRQLVRQHDAPVYTITYFAHWLLMASISKHGYKISVSGTAADELFSGYYDHHLAYLYEVRGDAKLHGKSRQAWFDHIQALVRNPFLKDPDAFLRHPEQRDHIFLNSEVFASCLSRHWSEPFQEERFSGDLLRNRMLNELFHENVPVILHEDDHNAMYYSIENRSPYLDRKLFEFSLRIPTCHLVRNGFAKAVLRDAVRGVVPDHVLDSRRKVGFNAPIFSFLDVRDSDMCSSLLADSPIFEHLRRERIQELLEKPDLPNSESKFLFYFLNAKLFLEEFAG